MPMRARTEKWKDDECDCPFFRWVNDAAEGAIGFCGVRQASIGGWRRFIPPSWCPLKMENLTANTLKRVLDKEIKHEDHVCYLEIEGKGVKKLTP